MSVAEAVRLAVRRLGVNRLRTALTTLGVVIGVGAVVALLGVGDGTKKQLTSGIASLGTNLVQVQAGASVTGGVRGAGGSATTLTVDDANALAKLDSVAAVAPEASVNGAVIASGTTNTTTSVTGTTDAEAKVRGYQVQSGSFLSPYEASRALKVAVVGPSTVADLGLNARTAVGRTITINGIPFTVIGVTQPKGGASGLSDPDDFVDVPLATAQARLTGQKNLRAIAVSVKNRRAVDTATSQITALLRFRHLSTESAATRLASNPSGSTDDFSIVSQDELLAVAGSQADTLRNFLIGIAAIALVIGGIGIANTMLVSVRERTREIGTRKAIGARRRDVSLQFAVEAVIVSLGGGVLGAALGAALTAPVGHAVKVDATPSLSGVGIAFAAAAVVGVLAGYWPARQAARLDPVEALRHE